MKRPKESVRRWWMDREGTVWINVRSARRKPLSDEEWAEIHRMVDEKVERVVDSLN